MSSTLSKGSEVESPLSLPDGEHPHIKIRAITGRINGLRIDLSGFVQMPDHNEGNVFLEDSLDNKDKIDIMNILTYSFVEGKEITIKIKSEKIISAKK